MAWRTRGREELPQQLALGENTSGKEAYWASRRPLHPSNIYRNCYPRSKPDTIPCFRSSWPWGSPSIDWYVRLDSTRTANIDQDVEQFSHCLSLIFKSFDYSKIYECSNSVLGIALTMLSQHPSVGAYGPQPMVDLDQLRLRLFGC